MKPVFAGDTITARVEIAEVIRERNRIRLHTACVNQRGEEVLSGEAWVMPSRTSMVYEEKRSGLSRMATWPLSPWTLAAQTVAVWSALGLALMGGATSANRR
jgi:hypothetical protein